MRKPTIVLTLLLALAAAAGHAQKLESQPGYVPIEKLDLFPPDKVSVEINLEGPLLHMVAAATKDDPAFSSVMAGLKSIKLQVFPLKGEDAGGRQGQDRARRQVAGGARVEVHDAGPRSGRGDLHLPQGNGREGPGADPAVLRSEGRGGGHQHRRPDRSGPDRQHRPDPAREGAGRRRRQEAEIAKKPE